MRILRYDFRHLLDAALADPDVVGVVHAGDHEPQDVGPVLLGGLDRQDHVAQRLRHLLALVVDDEAVGQDGLERGGPGRADGRQDRRLEPAAVLVGPLEIHERGIAQAEILRKHGAMARARLEPDVEDVSLLAERRAAALRAGRLRRYQLLDRPGEPGVRPALRKRSRKWRTVWAVRNWVWQVVQPSAGIGTPQDRWRLMHQSGRSDTMASIRDWPQEGSQFTSPIDFRVRRRRSL